MREYILQHAKIVEMIDFGDTHIFSDAPGQHNMVFVLERCGNPTSMVEERAANRPRLVRVKQEFDGQTLEERLTKLLNHIQEHATDKYEDDYILAFTSVAPQGSLSANSWSFASNQGVDDVLKLIEGCA